MSMIEKINQAIERQYFARIEVTWLQQCINFLQQQSPTGYLNYEQLLNQVEDQLLLSSLEHSTLGCFPESIATMNGKTLNGSYLVQIQELVNIAECNERRYTHSDNRTLKVTLTDGKTWIPGIEFVHIPQLSVNTLAGIKILLRNPKVLHGMVLLTPQCVTVLGGCVNSLVERVSQLKATTEKPLVPKEWEDELGKVDILPTNSKLEPDTNEDTDQLSTQNSVTNKSQFMAFEKQTMDSVTILHPAPPAQIESISTRPTLFTATNVLPSPTHNIVSKPSSSGNTFSADDWISTADLDSIDDYIMQSSQSSTHKNPLDLDDAVDESHISLQHTPNVKDDFAAMDEIENDFEPDDYATDARSGLPPAFDVIVTDHYSDVSSRPIRDQNSSVDNSQHRPLPNPLHSASIHSKQNSSSKEDYISLDDSDEEEKYTDQLTHNGDMRTAPLDYGLTSSQLGVLKQLQKLLPDIKTETLITELKSHRFNLNTSVEKLLANTSPKPDPPMVPLPPSSHNLSPTTSPLFAIKYSFGIQGNSTNSNSNSTSNSIDVRPPVTQYPSLTVSQLKKAHKGGTYSVLITKCDVMEVVPVENTFSVKVELMDSQDSIVMSITGPFARSLFDSSPVDWQKMITSSPYSGIIQDEKESVSQRLSGLHFIVRWEDTHRIWTVLDAT